MVRGHERAFLPADSAAEAVMATGYRPADTPDAARFGKVEIADADVQRLSGAAQVDRLVAGGMSRLSAERMVEIDRGTAEPGRARPHSQARR